MAEQAAMWIVGAIAIASHNTPATIAGVLLLGIVYARNLEFVHECIHATALRSVRANRIAGTLLAVPMFVSFSRWRREHAEHHRDVRREGFRYAYERLRTKRELLLHVFMVRHFADASASMSRAAFGRKSGYAPILCTLIAVAAVCVMLHSVFPLMLWLAPLPIAAVVHTHIELPEHFALEPADGSAFETSRILPAGPLATWFVNTNNFHAIHHWNARVPAAHVAATYAHVAATPARLQIDTYRAFYARFYGHFVTKSASVS